MHSLSRHLEGSCQLHFRHLYSREKDTHSTGGGVGPGGENNLLPLPKIEPRTLGFTARNKITIPVELSRLPIYFIVHLKMLSVAHTV
jgi:hypothetical protein